MLVDYHVHALGHADYTHSVENIVDFLTTARKRNIVEVGFADHDYYAQSFNLAAMREAAKLVPQVKVRLGIEIDFQPERVGEADELLAAFNLDFVIGSVHAIGDFVFDMESSLSQYSHWSIDKLYKAYYEILAQAAGNRQFDIIGHPDVIKVFNFRPEGSGLPYAQAALQAIKQAGLAIEINTNGRYKPAGEFYPAQDILKECFALSIPVTLSSDAHAPENVGRDVREAAELAYTVGYRRVATFVNRKRIMQPLSLSH